MNLPEVWNFFSYCSGSMKRGEFLGKRTITEWPNFNMKPVAAQDQCSLKSGNLMIGLNSPPERDVLWCRGQRSAVGFQKLKRSDDTDRTLGTALIRHPSANFDR